MHPVLKTNCWLWTGACVKYGMAWTGEKVTGAHRFSWFLAYGTWPENNACHHCDTPLCVRPDHLFDGDDQANTDDAKNKGRWPRGSDVGFSKLTESIVLEIRKKYADGASQRHLAKEYNVTQPNIGFIVRGDTWNHIPTLCSTEGRSVSKLTEEKVREIRESKDVTSDFLAEKYGVSRRTINQILSNETWKSKERT
jgi:DNA-binding XRE family transcriptional regulator